MIRTAARAIGLAMLFAAPVCPLFADAADGPNRTLPGQLRELARQQGFAVKGLERLEPVPATLSGSGREAVQRLLKDYDYVLEHSGTSGIQRLIVLGKKRPTPPAPTEHVLPTTRRGEHHWVSVSLQGASGDALDMELMVDTGASLVVLPSSSGEALGLTADRLKPRELQTAKGKVTAQTGRIKEIRLGSARVQDVEVALVEDAQLGGNALLGMNVLGRYVFILDDDNNQLILIPEPE